MRVTHLISNIEPGGAENSLCTLVEETRGASVSHTVVSMRPGGLQQRLESAGALVIALNARSGPGGLLSASAVAKTLRATRPDIVHGWMYHANVAASISAMCGYVRAPVLWGIRQSADDLSLDRHFTRFVVKSGALLSSHPSAIVYNSQGAAESHERLRYARSKRILIPNGIDCQRFQPSSIARRRLLAELELPEDAILIGRVARHAPMKDFPTLLRAFSRVASLWPQARLLLVGKGIDEDNRELAGLQRYLGCAGCVHFLGLRADMHLLYPALDLLVSSSRANESFPNSIAEALACGTLVVSTCVGDRSLVNEGCHRVIPPNAPDALAAGIESILRIAPLARKDLAVRGRNFILNNFDSRTFAANFVHLYRETLANGRS